MALTMVSCTTGVPVEQWQEASASAVPTCSTEPECELKWRAAREWILWNAGMELQHVTPDLMQTYNPPLNSTRFAARVEKEPMPQGGYRIIASVWCTNFLGCSPSEWDAVHNFNNYVNAVSPPAPSSAEAGPASFTCPPGTRWDGGWCVRNSVAPVWCAVPPNAWEGGVCVQPDRSRLKAPDQYP
jgi:hypothetical protein